ncbi:hypothetical protein [Thalassobius sp. Cn5-15]|jgi:hypothetical protein|uniref:hypothetical protein n=1 Tax=Thalassobius sp. Cn5-15 TaxID=2917763 RepID=UPI001EF1817B|nr:hypothetical protein [Thalassobius sp. Cn5-15]MCG7494587.1 hypothetical protein [Thalassobius sp. Cn5-15]
MTHDVNQNVSICIFGSSARATDDALSDRDVLIVAEDLSEIRPIISKWTESGWSVSCYSRTRFQNVANAGSLFVKHLQLEGRIVVDQSGWLAASLAQYNPKRSYTKELSEALDLSLPLERLMGSNALAEPALVADIGYVFLRNYAIYRCAQEMLYVFDYASLLEELQAIEGFSNKCREQLLSLRIGKHIFRSGYAALRDMSHLRCATDWIEEACSNLHLKEIAVGTPIRSLSTPYATLRDCEAALKVLGISPHNSDPLFTHLKMAWKMIESPKDYSWHLSKVDDVWVSKINAAIGRLNLPHAQHQVIRYGLGRTLG